MKKEMVGSAPGTVLGMLADLMHKLQHGVITPAELGLFLKKEKPFAKKDVLTSWTDFYCKFFGIEPDFSGLKLPEGKPGFDRLIVVTKGLTLNQVYDVCVKQFPCWRWTGDLDKTVIHNDRQPVETYAVWFRDRQEADKELKNLSADQLKEQGVQGITLLERLLYELKYWDETHKHLDVQNWTLCAGSRCSAGGVPVVRWYDGKLEVYWLCSSGRDDDLRSRTAVPCQP